MELKKRKEKKSETWIIGTEEKRQLEAFEM